MPTVLVSLPSGAGVVRLDDGTVALVGHTGHGEPVPLGEPDRFHPRKCEVDDYHSLVGGLLPPGAVAAEVVDDRGVRVAATVVDGAYVSEIEQPYDLHEAIVCCRDAAGDPVRRPWAADYPSEPVTDPREPCPACGSPEFDEYRPFESWRGGTLRPDGTTSPTPIVSCRACGHEQREAVVLVGRGSPSRTESRMTPDQRLARARAMQREHMWDAVSDGLLAQNFPVYAAPGWTLRISGCGSEDDGRLTDVTVAHYETPDASVVAADRPRLRVRTMLDDPQDAGPLDEVRQALRTWVRTDADKARPGRETSQAAAALWHDTRRREHNALVLGATECEQTITIDGTPAPALTLTASDGRWAAVAVRGGLTLVVSGHDLEPTSLQLAPVPDPGSVFGPPQDGESRTAR